MYKSMTKRFSLALLTLSLVLLAVPAHATDGIEITNILGFDVGYKGDILPDGSIVQGGSCNTEYFGAVKRLSNGALDTSWGDGGTVSYRVGAGADNFAGAVAQPDGKIVLAGALTTSKKGVRSSSIVLIRYDADGKLDKSFGRRGIVKTPLGTGNVGYAYNTLIQPDGKIVTTGLYWPEHVAPFRMLVVRYNYDGSLDSSFGSGGISISPFWMVDAVRVLGGALQGDKILVTAEAEHWSVDLSVLGEYGDWPVGGDYYTMVARFNSDGSLDTTFGNNGTVELDFYLLQQTAENMETVLVQPDGKIVLGGAVGGVIHSWWPDYQNANRGIARLNADGSIDTTFGDNGYVIENFFPDDISNYDGELVHGLGLLPDGRIAVVGALTELNFDYYEEHILVSTLNPDGSPDQWMLGPEGWPRRNAKVDAEGRIVGFGYVDFGSGNTSFMMFRLFDDLTFDLSF